MSGEEIVVVERSDLLGDGGFCGIRTEVSKYLRRLSADWFPALRPEAEKRTDWKQPIPYIMVTKNEKVFATRRTELSGEERLHNKISVGIGGHMRPGQQRPDASFDGLLWRNLYRELTEELTFDPTIPPAELQKYLHMVGVLNDDRDEVGRCHFGLVYLLQLPQNVSVGVRETDKLKGQLTAPQSLADGQHELEGWSMLCLRHLLDREGGCHRAE